MNPEQENFDQLRRLLKLKRHEQPSPRYFNDFSSQVIARIRAGEAGGRQTALDNASWLSLFWSLFEARPMLPGAIGVALCALLVFVAVYTDSPSGSIVTGTQPASSAPAPIFALSQDPVEGRAMAFASTNPVIQLGGSLFDQIRLSSPPTLVSRPFGNN
jgi:hypothetical protein